MIEGIAIFFMFLGGVNFSLHFLAWRHKQLGSYFRDPEFRAYFCGRWRWHVRRLLRWRCG